MHAILDWTNSILTIQIADNKYQIPIIYTEIYEEPEIFVIEVVKPNKTDMYMNEIHCHTFKQKKLEDGVREVTTKQYIDKSEDDSLAEYSYSTVKKKKERAISLTAYSCCNEVNCQCEYPNTTDWNNYTKRYQQDQYFNEIIKS